MQGAVARGRVWGGCEEEGCGEEGCGRGVGGRGRLVAQQGHRLVVAQAEARIAVAEVAEGVLRAHGGELFLLTAEGVKRRCSHLLVKRAAASSSWWLWFSPSKTAQKVRSSMSSTS